MTFQDPWKVGFDHLRNFSSVDPMPVTDSKQVGVAESIEQGFDDVRVLVDFAGVAQVHASFGCVGEFSDVIIYCCLSWLDFSFGLFALWNEFRNSLIVVVFLYRNPV